MDQNDQEEKIRIDKWLWAARFFKTRSLAADAVEGGKVHLNDTRVKPAKTLKPGDRLSIRVGRLEFLVVVRAVSGRRGPASEAAKLYEETEESRRAREELAARLKAEAPLYPDQKGRPTKKARRQIIRFVRGEG
jgi:ribosome-associated heat shock protein Hsp15